jgi:hypothetical protein
MQGDIVHAHRTIQTILAQQKELPPNVYNAKVPNPLSKNVTSILKLKSGQFFQKEVEFQCTHVRTKQYKK